MVAMSPYPFPSEPMDGYSGSVLIMQRRISTLCDFLAVVLREPSTSRDHWLSSIKKGGGAFILYALVRDNDRFFIT